MPPHGGHRGGGHHGGGGHHHHGGGRPPGGWQGGWGPGWAYPGVWYAEPGYSELIVTNPCPDVVDPVLGVDGKQYLNACKANAAGVAVAKKLGPSALKDYVTIGDLPVPKVALLAGLGVAAYLLLRKPKGGRHRSVARVRTAIARRR